MRWFCLVVLMSGCRAIFGIGSTAISDGSADDDAPRDTLPDVPANCVGQPAGLVKVCGMPAGPRDFVTDQTLDTTNDMVCDVVMAQTDSSAPVLCVVFGTSIQITSKLTITGPRPIVFASTANINIAGTVDVSSSRNGTRDGAGANFAHCVTNNGMNGANGAGGGGGGSFGGAGGKGGLGDQDGNMTAGGASTVGISTPTYVRGGCPGGVGGGGGGGGNGGGVGGPGGGAVYFLARDGITVGGKIYASGAGGSTGAQHDAGGGAGGSGGLIGLDAKTVAVGSGAILAANGGAGAGGNGADSAGASAGGDGTTAVPTSNAVHGVGETSGDGGDGSCYATPDGHDGGSSTRGAGGAGAGVGFVWVIGMFMNLGGTVSPNAQLH